MKPIQSSREFLQLYQSILPLLTEEVLREILDALHLKLGDYGKLKPLQEKQTLAREAAESWLEQNTLLFANFSDQQISLWKQFCVWETVGFGILEGLIPFNDFLQVVIHQQELICYEKDFDERTLAPRYPIGRGSDYRAVAQIEAELSIRINFSEPITERMWRGFLAQVAIKPVTPSPYIRIVNVQKLLELWPNTKLPPVS